VQPPLVQVLEEVSLRHLVEARRSAVGSEPAAQAEAAQAQLL
jgi:hypothetical protein